MKLIKLELSHFKGIRSFTLEPNGQPMMIEGENETGKSTIADAYSWLLFDRDTQDRSAQIFGIKTRDRKTGEEMSHLDHTVEGIIHHNGEDIKLKKVYKEKWHKPRGKAKQEMRGHEVNHFIDGVPKNQSEYKAFIESIISYERFKMISIPNFFAEILGMDNRREILFEMAGNITDEMIIASNPKLKRLPEALDGRTIEDQESVLAVERKNINNELKKLPERIDEAEKNITEDIDVEAVEKEIEKLESEKDKLESKLNQSDSEELQKLENRLSELDGLKISRKNELEEEKRKVISDELQARVSELKVNLEDAKIDVRAKKREIEDVDFKIKRIDPESIEKDIKTTKKLSPNKYDKDDTCPSCGQVLPEDSIKEAHEKHDKYVERFNENKAEKIAEYQENLKKAKADIKELSDKKEVLQSELQELIDTVSNIETDLSVAEGELETAKASVPDPMDDDTYKKYIKEQNQIEDEIVEVKSKTRNKKAEIEDDIQKVKTQIREENKKIAIHDSQERSRERIEKHEQQLDELSKRLEQIEADLFLFDEFKREKARYVTDRVNKLFRKVEWKLFKEQLNGGLKEICEATYKGIPFTEGLNTGGKVHAGIDIIRSLSDHFGMSSPVFLDNMESVTDELEYGSLQVIILKASKGVKKLSISKY